MAFTPRGVVLALLPLLIAYLLGFEISSTAFSSSSERVLLVTAHPDDEVFFFAPTLIDLHKQGVETHSLCLSNGNADGLGSVRLEELDRSLDVLGVDKARRGVVESPHLQDNITAAWDLRAVADAVKPYVLKHGITTILTFDTQGVSSHPNHIAIPLGLAHLLTSPAFALSLRPSPVPRLYSLGTVPLPNKYIGPIAAILAKFDIGVAALMRRFGWDAPVDANLGLDMHVFVSGRDDYLRSLGAVKAHASQLVWFRWLYAAFSRYMWVNEWVEVKPAGN
ncbi:hypothetical protein PLICRDRAFT_32348 [Plicaturopsis crispa FD-325 SS-3]|uniref:N-acetylglucosaminylphosphatidylinositol deacetylase n=1 Tax=Plicaturopsis crispa FD-325 SS-3 TaxID=944288 RepID=A0A0C9SR30_PLICR|nr:hypothetical protein PLICRDRAFT_32348 [Plicaturopsis crispa FD-325 SS-3]